MIAAMPQSLSKVILHIIFSTKNREPWLASGVRLRMHAYLATVCRDLGVDFVQVGGVSDHVHIVTTLPRTLSQAQLVELIKKTSSKWIKELNASYRGFFWQQGHLSLGKGEGEGEGFLEKLALAGRPRTPHLSPLPSSRGEANARWSARLRRVLGEPESV